MKANADISELLPGLSHCWVPVWELFSRYAGSFLKGRGFAPLLAFEEQDLLK